MTLTERLQAQLAAKTATDPRMRAILRRIQVGTASFSDTALYTRYLGEQLGGILADALPDAAPEEIAEAARVLLREAHADVTAQAAIVQEIQDRQLGASLAAQRPKYPAGRVEKVASSLTDQTVPVETRQRRARNASANVVASYHDTFIKENARIRSDAGFSCKTVRLGTQCCPWCAKLTGSYPAGSEPRDLFRRHDNCTCTIIYETRRTRQTLRGQGKSWNVVEEVEWKAPTRFSRNEAKALQEAEMGRLTKPLAGKTSNEGRQEIEAAPIHHTPKEKLDLAAYAKSLGIKYMNPMQFDGDIDLLKEQLAIMAWLRDEFKLPKEIALYITELGPDLGVTTYRKTIKLNSCAFRSDAATCAYLNADNKLAASKTIGIGVHEVGHLIAQKYGEIGLDKAKEVCYNSIEEHRAYIMTLDHLLDHVSEYSVTKDPLATSSRFRSTHYHEVIPEVLAKHFTDPDEFTTEFYKLLKKTCVEKGV